MKILFIGDIVGNPGRKTAKEEIGEIKRTLGFDFCIANCENAAGGRGLTYAVAQDIYNSGVDAITMGNHIWSKTEILNFIESDNRVIRPANLPEDVPGRGSSIISNDKGKKIGVMNLIGRVYMESANCPFRCADRELEKLKTHVKVVVVDMHAEATSEKSALAWYLDGRVSSVLGTHTHVQTADERILPCGTSFISDVGMTGPYEGILGVEREAVISKFMTQMPARFEVAKGTTQFNAVMLDIDETTGRTVSINRIYRILNSKIS